MSATLTFIAPPPGLAPLVDFTLDHIEGADGLYALRAKADTNRRLFVLDAAVHLPDYTPVLSDEQCEALDVFTPENVLLLVIVNPSEAGTTVNLMAPIVVNATTGACAQVILDDQEWPLRAELSARSA
ncbi:MAG TPA: flagellar assembly protein FliW [Propionibacteriaceae bacterium]